MAAMGEMIGHIGHQWRQPLNSLGIMFQRLNIVYHKDKLNDQIMSSSTEKAMRIISQMSKTIDDFRDFFITDKEFGNSKVTDVIMQAYNIIEPTLKTHGISLDVHTQNDVVVSCLQNELAQVILNIIANAMEAIVSQKIENGEISISIVNSNNLVSIIIDDNAGGIPEHIIDKIFEPYFTTKAKENGTGIGLYMSKTIMQEHMNGGIEVENTFYGASFKINLPMQ